MASGHEDGIIILSDLSSSRCVSALLGHNCSVWFSETCELCYGSSNILKLWSYQNCSKMVLPGGLIPLCSQVMDDSIFIVITIPIGGMGLLNVKDQSSLCLLFGLTLPSFSLALEEGGAGVQGVGAGGGGREGEAPYQDPPPLALGPCHLPLLPLHALSHQGMFCLSKYVVVVALYLTSNVIGMALFLVPAIYNILDNSLVKQNYSYYFEIKPLVEPTREIMKVNVNKYEWHELFPQGASYSLHPFALNSVYFYGHTDVVFCTIFGGKVERHDPTNFALVWNQIINSFHSEDLISNRFIQ
uniref:Uncharacterized protein n=1 Tax=Oryza brachyantha TaxID=4533 RepID=J3M5S2_ORYBR